MIPAAEKLNNLFSAVTIDKVRIELPQDNITIAYKLPFPREPFIQQPIEPLFLAIWVLQSCFQAPLLKLWVSV